MPRPINDNGEGQIIDLSEVPEQQLRPEFREACRKLCDDNLKMRPKIKTINNKPVTGYMLLGMALEFVDCFNRKEAPIVLTSFERVVSIESERFVE